jgi:D-xylose transport system ATP-binding protein
VVISHNLADVFDVADRITVLRMGRNAGDFVVGGTTQQEVVAAITGLQSPAHVPTERAGTKP